MSEEPKKVPEEESKDTKAEIKPEPKEEGKDIKVGDVLKTEKTEKKEVKMVPEAALLKYKSENKELTRKVEELMNSGGTKKEISSDLKALAEANGLDAEFLNDFAAKIRKDAQDDAEEKFNSRLKPIEEKENAEKRDKIFNEHYEKTLAEYPEYAKLVNKEVIKSLAMDPANANKTFAQIFNDSYGHLVTGKKTLEPTKPRGGKEDAGVDVARAQRDPEYFKEVMADPQLKKKYNEDIASRLKL